MKTHSEFVRELVDDLFADGCGPSAQEERMTSVGEDFPRQQERVRKLWGMHIRRGPRGALGAAALEGVLGRAASAQSSGDIVQILRAYDELVGCK